MVYDHLHLRLPLRDGSSDLGPLSGGGSEDHFPGDFGYFADQPGQASDGALRADGADYQEGAFQNKHGGTNWGEKTVLFEVCTFAMKTNGIGLFDRVTSFEKRVSERKSEFGTEGLEVALHNGGFWAESEQRLRG